MPDIFHDFPIRTTPSRVFAAMSTPAGFDQWWTTRSAGTPRIGAEYELRFDPGYDWRARVTRCEPDRAFELEFVQPDAEWIGTKVGFQLAAGDGTTQVRFYHAGWPRETGHYRISCYCWAMYLRVLRRYLEHGEIVPYEQRLDV